MSWSLHIYCFPNGNVAVCGDDRKQIPELQGTEEEAIPKIIKWLEDKKR